MTTSGLTTAATTSNPAKRPLYLVVKDHIIAAIATSNNGNINSVLTKWGDKKWFKLKLDQEKKISMRPRARTWSSKW